MSQCHEKVRSPRCFFFVNMFKMIILVYTPIYESVFYMFSSPCTAGTTTLCHSRRYPSVRDYEFGYRPICSYVRYCVDTRKYLHMWNSHNRTDICRFYSVLWSIQYFSIIARIWNSKSLSGSFCVSADSSWLEEMLLLMCEHKSNKPGPARGMGG